MVRRPFELVFAALLLVLAFVSPRTAHADPSSTDTLSVAVLSLDSDDAGDQADALTGALRSRVRASNAWSLVETSQALGMLAAALRCSTKSLTPECKERIATQLKAERYVFGYVTKGPTAGLVTAEVHLYQQGKSEAVARESFSDNLRDANDDSLRSVAQGILEKLGASVVGRLTVRLGEESGEVVIDGDKRIPLRKGVAQIELAPGTHAVEIVGGGPQKKRNVAVAAGTETTVDMTPAPPPPAPTESSFPGRKVLGGVLAAVGVAGFVVAGVYYGKYKDDQDKAQAFQNQLPEQTQDQHIVGQDPSTVCDDTVGRARHMTLCKLNDDRKQHSAVFWSTLGGGVLFAGAGAYFLLTSSGSGDAKAAQKTRIVPSVGLGGGSLTVLGTF